MVKDRNSYINLWKTLVSLTCVDNYISPEEREWIKKFIIDGKVLTEEEKSEILKELDSPQSPDTYFEKITIPSHMAQLHHLANNLFNSDNLDHKEEVYLKKINDMITSKVDFMSASRKTQDYLKDAQAKALQEEKNVKGIFQLLAYWYRS